MINKYTSPNTDTIKQKKPPAILFSLALVRKIKPLYLCWLLLETVLRTCVPLLLTLFPKLVLESIGKGEWREGILTAAAVVGAGFLLNAALILIEGRKEICNEEIAMTMRELLAGKMVRIRLEDLEQNSVAKQYHEAGKCMERGGIEGYLSQFMKFVSAVCVLVGLVRLFTAFEWWMYLVMVAALVMDTVGETKRSGYEYEEMEEETPISMGMQYSRERLGGKEYAKEIRLFGLYDYVVGKNVHYNEAFFEMSREYDRRHRKVFAWTYVAGALQLAVCYGYAASLYMRDRISVSTFSMYAVGLIQFKNALQDILSGVVRIRENGRYIRQLREFLCMAESERAQDGDSCGMSPDPGGWREIRLEHVSYRYGDGEDVLKDVNLSIKNGEKISLVGRNGAGKTTLVKLLMGFYRPTEGKILLDGRDIEEIPYGLYTKLFSAVFQDYTIFQFTVRENVSGDAQAHVEEVLDRLRMKEKVEALPRSYDTYVTQLFDEQGVEFSGGESQKLGLARALYSAASFLVLDEPTAALSPQGEYEIYRDFHELTQARTVLYISHRMASCKMSSRILVLDGGRITEEGSHEELLAREGIYAELFRGQAKYYE